jgi:crotonobetainyl-CoA:carnitine CoA-transferase CaiB-like acyl-CoA transferase
MSATLKLTHKAIGAEVRRSTYDAVVDGERVGSVELNDTFETPVEPGRHTLQVRSGRNSSRTKTFDAADGETVAFRCTGKRFLPLFLASFVVPSLALSSDASRRRLRTGPRRGHDASPPAATRSEKERALPAEGRGR